MGEYPKEQPRYHFTSTERESTNRHHIGTTRPHIHRTPSEADHKSQATQPTHNLPTKRARMTDAGHPHPGQILPGEHAAERGLVQQDISNKLRLTRQRHPITPTIPQKYSPKDPPRARTTISTTLHVPPADQQCTSRSHPTATINCRRNPSRHENGKVPTKHKPASPHCDPKKD